MSFGVGFGMGESVPVRCPECLRTQRYVAPVFPCACGAPVTPPVIAGATGEPVTQRNWTDEWVAVRCLSCGREDEWPYPELGCACGAVLRVQVRGLGEGARESFPGAGEPASEAGPGADDGTGDASGTASPTVMGMWSGTDSGAGADAPSATGSGTEATTWAAEPEARSGVRRDGHRPFGERYPAHTPLPPTAPRPAPPRPSFRPVTIRTARDAVAASAGYLRWLGFRDVVQPEERSASGVDLRAPGLVAQVDPSTRPATPKAVECLWLNGLSNSSVSVFFSLAGYTPEARSRADELGIPLFVLDLTGTPQPVNAPADELITTGA
ncbi:hypothetical protein [Streptomyces lateritius]